MTKEHTDQQHPLVKEVNTLSGLNSMANAWVKFFLKAYDALLHHGVNYRNLPEYQDPQNLLDAALDDKTSFEAGVSKVLTYIERLGNAVRAAVARKQFRREV